MKEVKIYSFSTELPARKDSIKLHSQRYPTIPVAEKELTELVNSGWQIVNASNVDHAIAFVVLIRET